MQIQAGTRYTVFDKLSSTGLKSPHLISLPRRLIEKGTALRKKLSVQKTKQTPTQQKQEEKLQKIEEGVETCLLKVHTVFPFDFFTDEITIDPTKVNIITREFFFSEDIHSIMIKNIKDVSIETSFFFATLRIVPDVYVGHPVSISYLWKKDAIHLRRIIQGLIVSQNEGVDPMRDIKPENLVKRIENLGALRGLEQKLSPLL